MSFVLQYTYHQTLKRMTDEQTVKPLLHAAILFHDVIIIDKIIQPLFDNTEMKRIIHLILTMI